MNKSRDELVRAEAEAHKAYYKARFTLVPDTAKAWDEAKIALRQYDEEHCE